ncbi:hypothetical protein ES703_94564 [subsurface metagenome]
MSYFTNIITGTVFRGHVRAINIEVAASDHWEPIIVVKEVAVKLAKKLCYLIGSVKVKGDKVLFEGKWCLTTINRTSRRGEDEFAYSGLPGAFQDFQSSESVDQEVSLGVVNRVLIGEVGGKVEDKVEPLREDPF